MNKLDKKGNKIMEIGRALSRNAMYEIGFDYKSYSVPSDEGTFIGTLDMKEWGKTPCLHCYFSTNDGRKMNLVAFFEKEYHPNKSDIDFSSETVKIGDKFLIAIKKSKNGKLRWENAEYISNAIET